LVGTGLHSVAPRKAAAHLEKIPWWVAVPLGINNDTSGNKDSRKAVLDGAFANSPDFKVERR